MINFVPSHLFSFILLHTPVVSMVKGKTEDSVQKDVTIALPYYTLPCMMSWQPPSCAQISDALHTKWIPTRGRLFYTAKCPERLRAHTQPPLQWIERAVSLDVKRPGREADNFLHLVLILKIVTLQFHYPFPSMGCRTKTSKHLLVSMMIMMKTMMTTTTTMMMIIIIITVIIILL